MTCLIEYDTFLPKLYKLITMDNKNKKFVFTEKHKNRVLELRKKEIFNVGLLTADRELFLTINKDFKENKNSEKFHQFIDSRTIYHKIYKDENGSYLPLGSISLFMSENNESIAIHLDDKYRGRGYGTKALEVYLSAIFNNTSINRIVNVIESGEKNVASIKMHENLGFKKIKLDGILYYGITGERLADLQRCRGKAKNFVLENIMPDGFGKEITGIFR